MDKENANAWYYQAAIQNYTLAQYKLAQNFENGIGINISHNDAVYWYTKAAENIMAMLFIRLA